MSPDAVQKGIEALENGANIYTDVEMVRTGISKPALKIRGNEVHCLIKDENVAKMAKELGVTRSIAAYAYIWANKFRKAKSLLSVMRLLHCMKYYA